MRAGEGGLVIVRKPLADTAVETPRATPPQPPNPPKRPIWLHANSPQIICTPLMYFSGGCGKGGGFRAEVVCFLTCCRLIIMQPPGECKQLSVSSSTGTGGVGGRVFSLWSVKTVYCQVDWKERKRGRGKGKRSHCGSSALQV